MSLTNREIQHRHRARFKERHGYSYSAVWKKKYPEKLRAQTAVQNAIRDGLLAKLPCVRCSSTIRVHGHHEDYSKPLSVIWFCPRHHAERHREILSGFPLRNTDLCERPMPLRESPPIAGARAAHLHPLQEKVFLSFKKILELVPRPSLKMIAEDCGYSSASVIHWHLMALEERGLVVRRNGVRVPVGTPQKSNAFVIGIPARTRADNLAARLAGRLHND